MEVQAAMGWGVSVAAASGAEQWGRGLAGGERTALGGRSDSCAASASVNADVKFGASRSKLSTHGGGRSAAELHACGRGRRGGAPPPSLLRWRRRPELCTCRAPRDGLRAGNAHVAQLEFFKRVEWRPSGARTLPARARAAQEDGAQESASSGPGDSANSSAEPQRPSSVPSAAVAQRGGKAGSLSFYTHDGESSSAAGAMAAPARSSDRLVSMLWLLGPFVLVASVVLPPLYLRRLFAAVLEDSLVTDFVILFFTETLFFVGAAVFLYVAHISRQTTSAAVASSTEQGSDPAAVVYPRGYRTSARIALGIGVLLPMASFIIVWPWTGPAAAAALAPYMIGLVVQLGFEHIIQSHRSPVWPLVPVTFQMYRLHQLNRAAQLVAGLLFSLKGVEATAETMAINGSLQTLLLVLQVLGMLCLWTLGSFLTNQMPTNLVHHSIPSLP